MTTRRAACQCGQLSLESHGEPVRISVCHCLDCQRRSGSAFAAQARFPQEAVTITGEARLWQRTADSGQTVFHHFCGTCGSTVYYRCCPNLDLIAVPLGAFGDPTFPPPRFSVYEKRQHTWVTILGDAVEHYE